LNKYDFDFVNIDKFLYDVLGIVDIDDIDSLKKQIYNNLKALSDAYDRKKSTSDESKNDMLRKEYDEVAGKTDLETVLRACISVRIAVVLSLEIKFREDDSSEDKTLKIKKRSRVYAISNLMKAVPSLTEFISKRRALFSCIDPEDRIVSYNKSDYDAPKAQKYPQNKLDLKFTPNPRGFLGEHGKVLEDAGIYVYKFGDLTHFRNPNEMGEYAFELDRRSLFGIIKKDEFDRLKTYSFITDDFNPDVPPEFYRDVLFSDMLLRNAENNLGFLGVPVKDSQEKTLFSNEEKYGYRVLFNPTGIEDMLSAIYFEDDPSKVLVTSNFQDAKNVQDAYSIIKRKMEKALAEISLKREEDEKGTGTRGN